MQNKIKQIPGYNGYFADETGQIYSNKRGEMTLLKQQKLGCCQYNSVMLYNNGKITTVCVHKLVALAFKDIPEGYTLEDAVDAFHKRCLVVDHIDGDKLNNNANNLRWCTPIENLGFNNYNHFKNTLKGNQNAKGHATPKERKRYNYYYNGKCYTMKELCDELKCTKSKITESFRCNLGLVKHGILTRKEKGE